MCSSSMAAGTTTPTPNLRIRVVPARRDPLVVRAGDLLRVGDDLRAAISIAEVALLRAEGRGATVADLRELLARLRGA